MNFQEIDIMYTNLQEASFSGYIKLSGSMGTGFIFLLHGGLIYAVEYANEYYQATTEWRLKNRAKYEDLKVSTYVIYSSLVHILSQLFAYDNIPEITNAKKKLPSALEDIEKKNFCGIMEISRKNEIDDYILFDQGKPITENIMNKCGSIICSSGGIESLIEESSREKQKIKFFGHSQGDIDIKKKQAERELSNLKELSVIIEKSGIFGSSDSAKVDPILFDEWQQIEGSGRKISEVLAENNKGFIQNFKVTTKKNLGINKILIPAKLLKKFEVFENETLVIKPGPT